MGFTIAPLQKRADQAGPVGSAAVFGHVDGAPPSQGLAGRKQARNPVAGGDVINTLHRPWSRRQRLAGSPISSLKVSSKHTTRRLGSYGRW
jgi:hypothetical protein